MADWSQAGGNAANAPGNVSLGGTSGAAVWRVRVIESAGKKNIRPAAPPLVYGGRIFVYDAAGTVTSLSPGGGRQWSVSLTPEDEKKSRTTGGGIAASGNAIYRRVRLRRARRARCRDRQPHLDLQDERAGALGADRLGRQGLRRQRHQRALCASMRPTARKPGNIRAFRNRPACSPRPARQFPATSSSCPTRRAR